MDTTDNDMFGMEDRPVCRICFDHIPTTPFISPCGCKGSQKYIHVACLRRWQSCVLDGKLAGDNMTEKAYRCGVCLTRFSLPPLKAPAWSMVSNWCRALLAVACLLLLAAGGGAQASVGGAWQHVILLSLLLLLGARSQPILLMLMLLVLGTMGALYARGLRLVVCMQVTTGGSWGLAVIRTGRSIEELMPGMLLVASHKLAHTLFKESVVLLLNHSSTHGAQGVLLNQPLISSMDTARYYTPVSTSSAPVGQHMNVAAGNSRAFDPTARAALNRIPGHNHRNSLLHASFSNQASHSHHNAALFSVQSEHLWNDIAHRHKDNLTFRRYMGGPVGLAAHHLSQPNEIPASSFAAGRLFSWLPPVRQVVDELTVLHDIPDVPGMRILHCSKPENDDPSHSSNDTVTSDPVVSDSVINTTTASNTTNRIADCSDEQAHQASESAAPINGRRFKSSEELGLWIGPSPAEVLLRATQILGTNNHIATHSQSDGSTPQSDKLKVLVFHGKTSWAPGQLEGELCNGMWGLMPATRAHIKAAAAGHTATLWSSLISSDELIWV